MLPSHGVYSASSPVRARLDFYRFGGDSLQGRHLLKWVHFQIDTRGRELELRYFRDIDGREVDFVVQISAVGTKDIVSREGIRVAPTLELLRTLRFCRCR
jgi:hypothetical protein